MDSLTELMNYEGVCRTAPATPGLLKSRPNNMLDVRQILHYFNYAKGMVMEFNLVEKNCHNIKMLYCQYFVHLLSASTSGEESF